MRYVAVPKSWRSVAEVSLRKPRSEELEQAISDACPMREHEGALYLGGVTNDKIGRLRLDGADRHWRGPDSYWGRRA